MATLPSCSLIARIFPFPFTNLGSKAANKRVISTIPLFTTQNFVQIPRTLPQPFLKLQRNLCLVPAKFKYNRGKDGKRTQNDDEDEDSDATDFSVSLLLITYTLFCLINLYVSRN